MKLLKILCIVLLTAGVASANSIGGPFEPDYRGDENSVHAVFDTNIPEPIVFEFEQSNYPLAPIGPWLLHDGFSISEFTLPNFIDDLPMKKMRIQLGFDSPVFGPDIFVELTGFDPEPVDWFVVGGSEILINEWHYIDIEMYPNPDFEEILIRTPFYPGALRTIEIDTVSIPEPASMALIGLVSGCAVVIRRFFCI